MNRLQTALSAALLAPLLPLTACSGNKSAPPPPGVPVQTQIAKTRPLDDVVHAQGILYPIHQASLAPKISAPVEKFFVNRGYQVHKGELLAILANKDLQAGVVSARGAYDQALADYQATTISTLPEEIQSARAALQNAQSNLQEQHRLYQSESSLYKQGAIPRKQLDATGVALVAARNAYLTAKKHLDNLQASGAKQQQAAAKGQMESARGRYLSAQAQLGYTEIRSPINGVVAERTVWPGDIAPAGTPLFVIMDVSKVVLRIHLPESQADQLHDGDSASLQVPGLKKSIPAKVSVISPALDPNSTTVEVWLVADNPGHRLAPGASIGASILVRKIPKALVIPDSAVLVNDKGQASVMTVGPHHIARTHPVVTGVRNNGLVQILSGIPPGAQVIVSGDYGLPDKSKVAPRPASADPSTGAQD